MAFLENLLPGASEALRDAPAAAAGQLHSGAVPPGLHGTEGVQAPPGGDGGMGRSIPELWPILGGTWWSNCNKMWVIKMCSCFFLVILVVEQRFWWGKMGGLGRERGFWKESGEETIWILPAKNMVEPNNSMNTWISEEKQRSGHASHRTWYLASADGRLSGKNVDWINWNFGSSPTKPNEANNAGETTRIELKPWKKIRPINLPQAPFVVRSL